MSNVLIGIIGVILFIGLALAGALFLGPRFQESTNNSKASAAVQAVSQAASALNMYRAQEGRQYTQYTLDDLKTANYLKSIPVNPVHAPYFPIVTSLNGDQVFTSADYVVMGLSPSGENQTVTDAVCLAIAKQTGQVPSSTTTVPSGTKPPLTATAGCIALTAGFSFSNAGQRVVFARV